MRPRSPGAVLQSADNSAFLVSNLINVLYLTGLSVTAGVVLITPKRFTLFVDGRYSEMASKNVNSGIAVRDVGTLTDVLAEVPECGCEAETVTIGQFRRWKKKFPHTKFIQMDGVIEEFRRSKEPDELSAFRRAQRITREILRRIPSALRTNVSEKKIGWQIEVWARELGADGLSFEPIVAFGTHSSRPHHRPTDRKLKRGQIVQIDCGAKYRGYCADQSAVYFTGKATSLEQHVYNTVLEAKDAAKAAIAVGVSTRLPDEIARKILRREGFEEYFTHGLGHGVGLEIHEGVSLSQRAPAKKLLKNEIVTVEPGIYLPGKFGIRLEEEIVVS